MPRGFSTPPEKVREVRALRERHLSVTMIAARTGVPRSTVGDIVRGEGEAIAEIRCEHCGADIIALGIGAGLRRFCDRDCWNRAHAEERREHMRRWRAKRKAAA